MHFVFPKNYNFKSKLLGFIDYSTAILDAILGLILYFIINLIFNDISTKIYVFISLFLPILLFSILGINKESFISVFIYIFKFCRNQNVYLYNKEITQKPSNEILVKNSYLLSNTFFKKVYSYIKNF
jgi:hypothetical protein